MKHVNYVPVSQANYDWTKTKYVGTTGLSLTTPDMALTIHEILARWTRGMSSPVMAGVNVDADLSDLDKLNQFELIDLKRATDARVASLRERVFQDKTAALEARREALTQKRIEDALAKAVKADPFATASERSKRE